MNWVDTHIEIAPPAKPKKITGTRFAAVLGRNHWATPFEVWCEVTRTYQKPFEDTIYTLAGKAIEPKQIAYMKNAYAMTDLRTPTDLFGLDYFKKTHGDFFPKLPIFGGMWDSLLVDEEERPRAVLEFKTTKRSEDWADDVPENYALQAALYAYLLGVEEVILVASFLEEGDYIEPEKFVPTAANTITVEFRLHERYPDFESLLAQAKSFWENSVMGGVSPDYDEKRDAEILDQLRTNHAAPEGDLLSLVAEAEALKAELDAAAAAVAPQSKRLAAIHEELKRQAIALFRPGDQKVEVKGNRFVWTIARSATASIDPAALKADGLLEKYTKPTVQYRMTVKPAKPDSVN